jgi:phage baseplate assembly protein gpV
MIEELLEEAAETIAGLKTKYFGVVTGRVLDVLDPMTLGRVQVQLPFIDSADLSPWCRVASPMAGMLSGHYSLPSIGDEVLVAFEHGDVQVPYIVGSLWNALSPPPFPTPLLEMRAIRTPIGNQVAFREAPPAVVITTPDATQQAIGAPPGITLSSNVMITLQCGATQLVLTPAGISITAPSVTITSSGPVTATGTTATVSGTGAVSVTAGASCTIAGAVVKIN